MLPNSYKLPGHYYPFISLLLSTWTVYLESKYLFSNEEIAVDIQSGQLLHTRHERRIVHSHRQLYEFVVRFCNVCCLLFSHTRFPIATLSIYCNRFYTTFLYLSFSCSRSLDCGTYFLAKTFKAYPFYDIFMIFSSFCQVDGADCFSPPAIINL